MKPIKIERKRISQVRHALEAVNGKAHSLTINHFSDVRSVVSDAEKVLALLPKKEHVGASAWYTPPGPPSAYKYAAISTAIQLTRKSSGWFLTDVKRVDLWPREPVRLDVTITSEQRDAIAHNATKNFQVIKDEVEQ